MITVVQGNRVEISYIFLVIIITTLFPHTSQLVIDDYSTCRDIKNFYNCGNLTNISYPFWGKNRPSHCGAGHHFYLNCHENNVTTILISSQNFTVLEINTTTHTMKLKRTDLQNLCPPKFVDTYLFPPMF